MIRNDLRIITRNIAHRMLSSYLVKLSTFGIIVTLPVFLR